MGPHLHAAFGTIAQDPVHPGGRVAAEHREDVPGLHTGARSGHRGARGCRWLPSDPCRQGRTGHCRERRRRDCPGPCVLRSPATYWRPAGSRHTYRQAGDDRRTVMHRRGDPDRGHLARGTLDLRCGLAHWSRDWRGDAARVRPSCRFHTQGQARPDHGLGRARAGTRRRRGSVTGRWYRRCRRAALGAGCASSSGGSGSVRRARRCPQPRSVAREPR